MTQHGRAVPAGIKTLSRVLFPALALLFCGATEAPVLKPATPIVVAFGDSLAAGYGLAGGATQAWPAVLGEKMKAAHPGVVVVNAGLSGETSAGGLRRIDWVLKRPADIFILELGGNDGLRGLPPAAMAKNLQGILDKVRAKYPKAKIVIAGMRMPANTGMYAKSFDAVFPELAKKNGATLVPFILEGVADHPELMQDDGIHPNAAGHRRVAELVWAKLQPALATTPEPDKKQTEKTQ